jgi:hypothetical protein
MERENSQRALNPGLSAERDGGSPIHPVLTGRIDLLGKLLSLSRAHLRFALEENWETWETIAQQKKDLYAQLLAFTDSSAHPAEKEIVDAIREAEKEMLEELNRKKNEVKKELAEIDRSTGGIENYRQSCHKSSKRGLNIKI